MVKYQTIAQLLRASFPDWSARRISKVIGVNHSTVSRWLDDEKLPTSMENCLNIAKACGVEPKEVFRIAGKDEFGALLGHYRTNTPTLAQAYGNPSHRELAKRFDRLLRLGWQDRLDEELRKLEAYWDFARRPFQSLAAEHQATAAILSMGHPKTGQVILHTHRIRPEEALAVLDEPKKQKGWQQRSHTNKSLTLTLHFRTSRDLEEDAIEISLRSWTGSLQTLLP